MNTPHILIVEDDKDIGLLVAKYLKANEMRVTTAENGRAMDRVLADTRISLIVLDRMLPGEDGLSICRRLRASSDIPIIILTARGEEAERVRGLSTGADDYVVKPFSVPELIARVQALLRRAKPEHVASSLRAGELEIDREKRRVSRSGRDIDLGPTEYRLL